MTTVDILLDDGRWEGIELHYHLWNVCKGRVVVQTASGPAWYDLVEYHSEAAHMETFAAAQVCQVWLDNFHTGKFVMRFVFDDPAEAALFKMRFL